MSTIIVGNTISYTAANLLDVNGAIILRQPTANTTDDFNLTATALLTAFLGVLDAQYDGTAFSVTIQNDSLFTITQACTGTGVTMGPSSTVVIPPDASVTFIFLQEDGSIPTVSVSIENSRTMFAPASSTDNAIARFDGTSGSVIQNSTVTISDAGAIAGITTIAVDSVILNGATSGTVTLQAPAVVTSYVLTFPADDGLPGQILSTDGSGVTTWINNTAIVAQFYAFGPAAAVAVTATFATVIVVTSVNVGGYANAAGVVTLPATGTYEVSYTSQFESLDNSGGATSSFAGRLLLNAAVVGGSITECYMSENNGNLHRPSCTKTVIFTATATNTLALQVARTAGTSTGQTRVNQCTMTIVQIA